MSKLVAGLVALMLLASPAAASILRIDLTRANQATSPVAYTLKTSKASGLVIVDLAVARDQAPLTHLWRIDLVLRKGKRTVVSAPLATTVDGESLTTQLILDPTAMRSAEIWIRTGEHAPLAETVYVIDVGSFR